MPPPTTRIFSLEEWTEALILSGALLTLKASAETRKSNNSNLIGVCFEFMSSIIPDLFIRTQVSGKASRLQSENRGESSDERSK